MNLRRTVGPALAVSVSLAALALWPHQAGRPDRPAAARPPEPAPAAARPAPGPAKEPEGNTARAEPARPVEPARPGEPPEGPEIVRPTERLAAAPPPAAIEAGKPVPAAPPISSTLGEAEIGQVRDAVAAYRRGELPLGDAIRAKVADPAAVLLLEWAALRTPGLGLDSERVLDFIRRNPDWPGQTWLRRKAEDALVAERKPGPAIRAFFGSDKPQTPAGKFALALALKAEGKGAEATALVRDTWRSDSFGRELESRILDGFKDALATPDHRLRMERFLLKENWEVARRAAEYAGEGYDALVKARVAVEGRSPKAAKILDAVPKALKADSSFLFSRAQFLRRQDKAEEAAKVLASAPTAPEILGDGDEWWVERRLVARKLLDEGSAKAAYAVVAAPVAVSAERRIEAEFHAGWIALRYLKQPEAARSHFAAAAALAGSPISVSRALYWQGRAAEEAGHRDEAKARYREAARFGITYYGQLAAARLGEEPGPIRSAALRGSEGRKGAAARPVARALAYAYAAGLRELALPLVAELGKSSQDVAQLDAAAEVLAENRDARALLTLGKLATQRGMPLDEPAFPIDGVPSFEPVGNRVERAMVQAIARQESAFDPAAQSSAGARGLMQMMPATARMTAKKAGVEFEPNRLSDGVYNARLGAAHLGDLMQDWKGSYILTFAAYNAGPGNVRKWLQAYGDPRDPGVDAVDWVERIPFSETRNYVQRVMENLQVYRRRLDARSALLTESDLKRGGAGPRPVTAPDP